MSDLNLETLLEHAKNIASEAGQLIKYLRSKNEIGLDYKAGKELVTTADLKSDELICARIKSLYPDHQILSEESTPDLSSEKVTKGPLWIIDPIDGTVNYAHGHHNVAVSIGFYIDGQATVGVVFNPFTEEMFSAIKGRGAFRNEEPIEVSHHTDLSTALVATGFPYVKDEVPQLVNRVQNVLMNCQDIRRVGAASLDICWIAMGRLDGYFESLSVWDFAAAILIAREAGAKTGHLYKGPDNIPEDLWNRDLIMCTPEIYDGLKALVVDADTEFKSKQN